MARNDFVFEKDYLILNIMSCVMRKQAFCICENKDADQLCGNLISAFVFATQIVQSLISAFVFATQIVQSLYFLNSHLL